MTPAPNGVLGAALSLDGDTLVTASLDATARVWDLRSGKTIHVLRGHTDGVASVAITARGETAITSSRDGTERVWDLRTRACLGLYQRPRAWFSKVAITEDGTLAMSCSSAQMPRFWRPGTDAPVERSLLFGFNTYSAAMGRDGNTVVRGTRSGEIGLWDSRDGNLRRSWHAHTDVVNDVALSRDGNTLLSASADKMACVWDIAPKWRRDVWTLMSTRRWDAEMGRELVEFIQ